MNTEKLYFPITILLALSALFLPFWVTAVVFIGANILYRNYYPGLIIIFIADAVYSFETVSIGPAYAMLTISAIILFLLIGALKESLFITKRL